MAEMESNGKPTPPAGTMYKVVITLHTQGWGIDADNSAKGILDALNGIAIDDDSRVTELVIKKHTHQKGFGFDVEVHEVGFRTLSTARKPRESVKTSKRRNGPRPFRKKRAFRSGKKGAGK